ncbi:MAG: hypothetical protein WCG76_03150 [Verrucomicrobiota bacterium]|jgi:hypothetical protein
MENNGAFQSGGFKLTSPPPRKWVNVHCTDPVNKSGFRDNLQNDMALALCDYPLVKQNLSWAVASQNRDGSIPHGSPFIQPPDGGHHTVQVTT